MPGTFGTWVIAGLGAGLGWAIGSWLGGLLISAVMWLIHKIAS